MNRRDKALRVHTRNTRAPNQDRADIVIVGNGIAGLTAAVEARRLDAEQRIVIITEQSHPTINTPALKQFATGKLAQEQLLAYPAGTERSRQIEVINARVEEIRSKGKYLCLGDGESFGYGTLLLATGSKPNGLPTTVPGRNFDGVISLHRLNDYLDLRRRLRLREVNDAVVIGGGLHAIENVIALLHWGIRVHWLIRGKTFLPRLLDSTASDMVLEYSRRAGAQVSTETEVVGIVGRVGSVAGVVTNHQQTLSCQLVLICTGTTPDTTLAEQCDVPLKHRQGFLVDDHLSTNVHDIFAAGDAAALWNPRSAAYQPQAYWHAAVSQGSVAAAAMTGSYEALTPFGVPWHATHIGELSLLSVGNPLHEFEAEATVTDKRRGGYRRLSMRDDRLVGYMSLGTTQPDGLAMKRIIDEGHSIREFEWSLRSGEFDARQYFAQRHAHAAHTMAITGKLPLINTPQPLAHEAEEPILARDTEPLLLSQILHGQDGISSTKIRMHDQSETTEWIVPNVLPEGLVILAGKQQIGKSWLGLGIGLGVASGEAVLGGTIIEQGNVLYIALEESDRMLKERLSQLLVMGASLHSDFEYATSWPCLDDDGLTDIKDWLVSHPLARLVIIDSWLEAQPRGKLYGGAAHDADYEAFEELRQLAHTYNICILVHYHIDETTPDHLFDELTARASANACADGILHLKRVGSARSNHQAMLHGTGRAYAQGLDLALSFDEGCWKTAGKSPARMLDSLPKARRAIIDVLHEQDRPMKPKEIALALGKLDGTIRKMLFEMKASSLVKETDQGYVALVPKVEGTIQHRSESLVAVTR